MLGNYLDLKPISGYARGPNKLLPGGSARFYNQHFPLLLEKPFRDEEPAENKVVGRFGFVSVSTATDLSYVINSVTIENVCLTASQHVAQHGQGSK